MQRPARWPCGCAASTPARQTRRVASSTATARRAHRGAARGARPLARRAPPARAEHGRIRPRHRDYGRALPGRRHHQRARPRAHPRRDARLLRPLARGAPALAHDDDAAPGRPARPQPALALLQHWGVASGFGDDWLKLGGVKIFLDGAISKGAAMMEVPYLASAHPHGIQAKSDADLCAIVRQAHADGWQVGVHSSGDRRCACCSTATRRQTRTRRSRTAASRPSTPTSCGRRIVSAPVRWASWSCRSRAVARGAWAEPVLGAKRAGQAWPLRDYLDAGLHLAGGSDAPLYPYEPLYSIWAAVARQVEATSRRSAGAAPQPAGGAAAVHQRGSPRHVRRAPQGHARAREARGRRRARRRSTDLPGSRPEGPPCTAHRRRRAHRLPLAGAGLTNFGKPSRSGLCTAASPIARRRWPDGLRANPPEQLLHCGIVYRSPTLA